MSKRPHLFVPLPKQEGPERKDNLSTSCVGCGKSVTPGLVYTGKVLKGSMIREKMSTINTPIEAVFVNTLCTPTEIDFVGGDQVQTVKRMGFPVYNKGYICTECASDYRHDSRGNPHVVTDALPGTILKGAIKSKGQIVRDGDNYRTSDSYEGKKYSSTVLRGTWRPPRRKR